MTTKAHLEESRKQLAEVTAVSDSLHQALVQERARAAHLDSDLKRTMARLKALQGEKEELVGQVEDLQAKVADHIASEALPRRVKMGRERESLTHKFVIHAVEMGEDDRPVPVDYDGYITIGLYANGEVGEFFLRLAKQGSIVGGFADQWAVACSLLLQLGHPLEDLCRRFKDTSFEPSGRTETPGIRTAKSVVDYICKYMLRRFVMKLPLQDDPT